jgi:biopolymer transport protein ExbB/TolQ
MSMIAIGIALERLITFLRARSRSLAYVAELQPLVVAGSGAVDQQLAAAVSLEAKWKQAPLARIMGCGIQEFAQGLQELGSAANDPVELELLVNGSGRTMERAQKREIAELQRGLPILATIASSAPFVGLFGTVFGIITAFQQMADPEGGGGGGLATVSAGIAEALFTTAVGLAVAIIAVWMYNFFTTYATGVSVMFEDATGELTDRLSHMARRRNAHPQQAPSIPPPVSQQQSQLPPLPVPPAALTSRS